MGTKLELRNISKSYGRTRVIDNMSLEVEEGEFFVVLGPSGTGKSTLLKIIVGIEQPDSGKVFIDGKDVTRLPPNKRNLAMVFQNYALYPNLNVYNNIAFPLKMHRIRYIDRKVKEVAAKLNITEILQKRIYQISGGQQQRVALARAIVRNPSMFLLDEPLSNLDARVRYTARSELKKLQQELNQTFVFVTHDQKEAEALGDRVGVLHNGVFEQISDYRDLYENPKTAWIGDFVGDFPINIIEHKGFRPEWAKIGSGKFSMNVSLSESVSDVYFIHGLMDDGTGIILKSNKFFKSGEVVHFSVEKFVEFKNAESAPQISDFTGKSA
ncbi:MAG: ABC transporter ATP-binding protein [Thermoplasmatales archaeon]|nr:ABC transporter ATP-binding protein [Thermoplasmatales archaeon]MCW6169818.1 ABC transporter ATP-binding protein [Thermoplasmatales archaeon]